MGEIFIPFWHQKFHIRTLLQKISDVFFILFYRKCTGRIQEHSALFQHIRRIEQLVRTISDKYFLLSRRVDLLLLKSLRAKVCAYLLSEAEVHHSLTFTIPYSRIQLADYLNCDRSALSRELSLMQRDGLLETYRSSFKLLEPEALRRMVL